MTRIIFTLLLFFSLTACAGWQGGEDSSKRETNNYRDDLKKIAQGKNVQVFNTSYLGATVVHKQTSSYPPEFKTKVAVRTTGSLTDLVEQVRSAAKVNFRVEQGGQTAAPVATAIAPTSGPMPIASFRGAGPVPIAEGLDGGDSGGAEIRRSIHYSGDIEGYFHMLANKFGAEWTYDEEKRLVEFDFHCTKTFSVYAMPGDTSYKSTISNAASSAGSADAASTSGASTEAAQINENKFGGNFWTTLSESVATMLTQGGKSSCNQNSGTVTVTDTPKVVRSVEQYIAQLNQKLGRQIAYEVRVLALQTNDSDTTGFDLNALIESNSVGISTTPVKAYKTLDDTGSITAMLLSGQGKGSTAIVSALKSWGDVSQITSASGFAMHNTPTPVQVGGETGYVSSTATTLDGQGNSTSTISTSKVTEGFYMTVVPNILKDNNVLLQYNVSLSNIEDIKTFEASDDTKVQLPEVTSRSFSQKVRMQMGQTLVLGGFQQTVMTESKGYGILGGGSSNEKHKRIIVIIISIDSAGE